jgi:hypothetical protein
VRSGFRLGWPDDWAVAVEEDASDFGGGGVSLLLGTGRREEAIWFNGEVDVVDELEQGGEAGSAWGDVEVGFHIRFEAGKGVWQTKLGRQNQQTMLFHATKNDMLTLRGVDGIVDEVRWAWSFSTWVACLRTEAVSFSAASDGPREGVAIGVLLPEDDDEIDREYRLREDTLVEYKGFLGMREADSGCVLRFLPLVSVDERGDSVTPSGTM